jgi:hypothetical protein
MRVLLMSPSFVSATTEAFPPQSSVPTIIADSVARRRSIIASGIMTMSDPVLMERISMPLESLTQMTCYLR